MHRRDYLLLGAFCLLLFGLSTVSGRPLSVHEAVLPQSAREMLADGDWVVPKKGGTPWLESPPLPQWITVALARLVGRCDEVWIVRFGPTLMATATVFLAAWMASILFGRTWGLLSGFILATTCQFTRYAWLAEDEIFLCAVVAAAMALFVRIEFGDEPVDAPLSGGPVRAFFGGRSWWVLAFFVVLGMTNLVKGLFFGTAMVVIPIALYLLWNADLGRIMRFVWLWGWLAFAAVTVAWPLAAYARFADAADVWFYDLGGRLSGSYVELTEPIWYYPLNLLWILAPWTIVVPVGLWATRHRVRHVRFSAERFVWCWALGVPLAFSFAHGKHHHYLLHALVPWAVLASFGLVQTRRWFQTWPRWLRNPWLSLLTVAAPASMAVWLLWEAIRGPAWLPVVLLCVIPVVSLGLTWAVHHAPPRLAAAVLFLAAGSAFGFGHVYAGRYVDRHRFDAEFLKQVEATVAAEASLLVDLEVAPLRGFFCLFYLRETAHPLHNLSFTLDQRIDRRDDVYLLTRANKIPQVAEWTDAEIVLQNSHSTRDGFEDGPLTLFRLKYRPGAPRVAAEKVRVSPMQAMYRTAGPDLQRL